jgi:hypothetical protein
MMSNLKETQDAKKWIGERFARKEGGQRKVLSLGAEK